MVKIGNTEKRNHSNAVIISADFFTRHLRKNKIKQIKSIWLKAPIMENTNGSDSLSIVTVGKHFEIARIEI
jgi:hypothetical protein